MNYTIMKNYLLMLCMVLPLLGCKAQVDTPNAKPNVLLIMVDDLKPAINAFGDKHALTPNLDKLTKKGMRFDNAYANQAVCAPSRFTLMLGSHGTNTGLYSLGNKLREKIPNAVTMPQYFAKHGYRTESLGKIFHIGHGNPGDDQSFSVPHFKDKVVEYVLPESTDGGQLTIEEAYFQNKAILDDNGAKLPKGAAYEAPEVEDEAYADGRVANETIKRLREAKERGTPFFIASGYARPHLPFCAPKKYWDMYDPNMLPVTNINQMPKGAPEGAGKNILSEIGNYKPTTEALLHTEEYKRKLVHGYYASTSYVDAQIGKVIDELDRLDLTKNTIIVLWGDHGFHLGELGIWTKHVNYEIATHIPIVVVAEGVTKPNSSTQQFAETVDVFPTLCELAGLPQPKENVVQPIDGVSLVPVLKDSEARVRDYAYHYYPKKQLGIGRAIRTNQYRMVEWTKKGKEPVYELYDYTDGDLETVNIAEQNPEIIEKLSSILAQYPKPKPKFGKKKNNK
ncbi:sulfatase [uncultured Algibacter sp.]|uniref:sulfatase n=1 Tax=uncultured Algibacter sp. TaxID=298659 RepID=UPI0026354E07|nr:sulfatase [uncultured Algibacter sp.]